MSRGTIDFDFRFDRGPRAARSTPDRPFRILVLADLGASQRPPLARRRPVNVDLDSLDTVFAGVAPVLELELDGAPLAVPFLDFDDFHPDRLFQRLEPFAALRRLREELADARTFRRAAVAFGLLPAAEAVVASPSATADAAADFERLLGRRPDPVAARVGGFDLQAWMRAALGPHLVPDIRDEQRRCLAAADAAISQTMRKLLRAPPLQALEGSWRGIARVVQEAELDEDLQLWLLDVSQQELAADLAAAAADPAQSAVFGHLRGDGAVDSAGWSLLVSDFAVAGSDQEVRHLAILGYLAARAGVPLLAAARPSLIGAGDGDELRDPSAWTGAAAEAAWSALRQSEIAPWIGLVIPRVLLRLPYGAATDPIDSFAFEELPESRDHEAYLWGDPALALALLAAQTFRHDGWSMDLDQHLELADLPSHSYREDGEVRQQPCAEWLLGEAAGTALLSRGLMPLLSYRNRNAARLLRWQSIADPAQALRGAWAVRSG